MKNDYKRNDFWEIEINGEKHYYIKVKKQRIEVTRDVYCVCRNSYMKIYNNAYADSIRIQHCDSDLYLFENYHYYDPERMLEKHETEKMINKAIALLKSEEKYIIYELFYKDTKEADIALKLGISQQSVNYKKKKIIKKMRNILLKEL